MSGLWSWIRRRFTPDVPPFLASGEAWRTDGPDEQPELFEVEVCRGCGCSELAACEGGCYWVGRGLCSRCVPGYGGTD